ncbi:UDP-glucose--hexose-1-phosphate uridylyltransferase [Phnomibacter ginsenosidimutans]|uniref:Galactose-1-phosphate uridylyltransferase n=1 Tax=Phnomibacter ginsenosidimutans TaxID=2676868 RepID=A0A6I6G7T3_9BACT|nr:UDP-glucose--hexose-1-phosphate uridylyltransferase [Phnomibacter ginsenosidimutans]QGW27553.1 UDP-glucose--hexose-1-phosphate uridylyltransferase [Phnomibacter ginsenosidimutans]
MFSIHEHAHTRLNLLTGDWVLVSPHRTKRPWQGKVETLPADNRPAYDATCYLCPGNKRADGATNPDYTDSFVFVNDFSALLTDTPDGDVNINGLLQAKSAKGICKVISFSPDHSKTLPTLPVSTIAKVIDLWCAEMTSIAQDKDIQYIQIFENKGDIMGCSNPHPHGQIWAQNSVPLEVSKETKQQQQYYERYWRTLLSDYVNTELQQQERIVLEHEHFVALVPFWAVWPFETMIVPKRPMAQINEMTQDERLAFAIMLKELTAKYDNLFHVSFPYSAGIHQAPVNNGQHPAWHWHMHFYPPLLRSATVKKFMVGYEMLANPQRDVTPEWAAERLRSLPVKHYKEM